MVYVVSQRRNKNPSAVSKKPPTNNKTKSTEHSLLRPSKIQDTQLYPSKHRSLKRFYPSAVDSTPMERRMQKRLNRITALNRHVWFKAFTRHCLQELTSSSTFTSDVKHKDFPSKNMLREMWKSWCSVSRCRTMSASGVTATLQFASTLLVTCIAKDFAGMDRMALHLHRFLSALSVNTTAHPHKGKSPDIHTQKPFPGGYAGGKLQLSVPASTLAMTSVCADPTPLPHKDNSLEDTALCSFSESFLQPLARSGGLLTTGVVLQSWSLWGITQTASRGSPLPAHTGTVGFVSPPLSKPHRVR
jgi:hypothetical protein